MFKIDERLPKESAKDYVVRQLVYNIVHINLTPGQQLDSDEISELLNVSKNPIREAGSTNAYFSAHLAATVCALPDIS